MASKARVLVVDDDPSLRSLLVMALRREGWDARAEADGTAIKEVATEYEPDLVILDVRLGTGPNGFALARELRGISDIAILFLTVAESTEARLAGFEAGADDYLVKPFEVEELVARVRALLRRVGRLSSPAAVRVGDLVIDGAARRVTRGEEAIDLTRTEYELLSVLVKHRGQVLSKTQLLDAVWGFDAYDTNLVQVHMSALRRKLGAKGSRLVHTVRGVGYVVPDEESGEDSGAPGEGRAGIEGGH